MNAKRRLPTTEQAVESVKQGMLDDRILHLSDEELREALTADDRRVNAVSSSRKRVSWMRSVARVGEERRMSVPRPLPPELAATPSWKGREPAWFGPTRRSIQELLQLPENWNSYGARQVEPDLAASALKLLVKVAPTDAPPPIVVPTTRGGILLEWHMREIDLEIETLAADSFHVFYEDGREGREWECDLTTATAAPIAEFLATLSQRSA